MSDDPTFVTRAGVVGLIVPAVPVILGASILLPECVGGMECIAVGLLGVYLLVVGAPTTLVALPFTGGRGLSGVLIAGAIGIATAAPMWWWIGRAVARTSDGWLVFIGRWIGVHVVWALLLIGVATLLLRVA